MRKMGIIVLFAGALSVNASLIGHFTAEDGLELVKGNQVSAWKNKVQGSTAVVDIEVEIPKNTAFDDSTVMDSGRRGVLWNRAGRAPIIKEDQLAGILDFSAGGSGKNRGVTIVAAFEPLDLSAENNIVAVAGGNRWPNFQLSMNNGALVVVLNDSTQLKKNRMYGSNVAVGQTVVAGFSYSAQTGEVIYWDSLGTFSTDHLSTNAIFSSSELFFAGSKKKGQEMDCIIGELRIYDEFMEAASFGAVCKEMTGTWVMNEPVKKDVAIDSIAKTDRSETKSQIPAPTSASKLTQTAEPEPTLKPERAPSQYKESASAVFGMIVVAPILLLLFRRT